MVGKCGHAELFLQLGSAFERVDELQGDHRRVSLRAARWNSPLPAPSPVHERPPRDRTEHAGVVDPLLEPAEDRPNPRKEAAHVVGLVAVHPVVVDHRDPDRREGRNVLPEVGRVAAGGDPFGDPREIEMLDRLTHETIVVAHVERDQRLDASIAHVLELLVVRRIEIRLPCAEPRAAPVDLPHVREPGEIAVEPSDQLERIAHEDAVQVVYADSFVSCLDLELHVAVGSEPERLEAATLAAIEVKLVTDTGDRLAIDVVAIALVSLSILECFGVDEPDGASRTTTRLENGECIGEVPLVEQNNCPCLCRHDEVARSSEEAGIRRDSVTAPNGVEPYGRLLHRWDRTRHELPAARFPERIAGAKLRAVGAGAPASRRRDPAVVGEVGLRPAPWITACVDRLAWWRRVVAANGIAQNGNRSVAFVAEHLPFGT